MRSSLCASTFLPLLFGGFFACFCLFVPSAAQAALPQRFHQDQVIEPIRGLVGASIGDIVWSGRYLWVGTESGLARLDPSQASGLEVGDWVTYTERNGIGRGGISALAAVGDTVWIATVFDTTIVNVDFDVGAGLSFSHDGGETWQHIPNETIFDTSRPGFEPGPTTNINNPCWDLAIDGTTIWAAFFSGSSVRSPDGGQTWERVLPDGADEIVFATPSPAADSLKILADSLANAGGSPAQIELLRTQADSLENQTLMHRTFSVLAYGDTVWIGTSNGMGRSFDNGRTWNNIRVRQDRDGALIPGNIGGNWVVTLERQFMPDGTTAIWAGTRITDREGGVNSISFSRDNGRTWTVTGPTFAWDFAFTRNKIWASANALGLLASSDQGATWEPIAVEDPFLRDQLRGTFVGLETLGDTLWVGAENGLGLTADEGEIWRILRSPVRTRSIDTRAFIGTGALADSTHATYAAPNPFAPSRGEQARIVYSLAQDAQVTIKIYDFASRLVRTLIDDEGQDGQHNYGRNWDGLDDDGRPVANGVYLYRIELNTGKQAFGKVVVLN